MDPHSLSWWLWLTAGAIFLGAGFFHGLLGLGFSMLATPLLAILLDFREAILLTLLPTVTVNLFSILRGGHWSQSIGRYWPLAVMIPCGAWLGSWLLVHIDPAPFRLLLAGVIGLHLAGPRLRGLPLSWIRTRPGLAYTGFGFASGFLAGTVNVMVPLLIVFALEIGMAPVAMVQVFNLCFLTGKLVQMGVFAHAGLLGWALVPAMLPMALGTALAWTLGMRIRERVATETYRGWLRKVLIVMIGILVLPYATGH